MGQSTPRPYVVCVWKSLGSRRTEVPIQCQVVPPPTRSYVLAKGSGPVCTRYEPGVGASGFVVRVPGSSLRGRGALGMLGYGDSGTLLMAV